VRFHRYLAMFANSNSL